MNDCIKVPTTREVAAVLRASHPNMTVFTSLSDPYGMVFGGSGERGRMETGWGLPGTDYPILMTRNEWNIGEGGKRTDETWHYWLCVARRQE